MSLPLRALCLVTLLAGFVGAEEPTRSTLSNDARISYVRNLLIAANRQHLGNWTEPAEPAQRNPFYVGNRAPLRATAYVSLPLGAVRPEGWLLDQLHAQADGMSGNFYQSIRATIGENGDGTSGSGGAELFNFFEGFIPLAILLDDPALKERARSYIFNELAGQLAHPLATVSGSNGESAYQSLRALIEYTDATNDSQALALVQGFFAAIGDATIWDQRTYGRWERWRTGEYIHIAHWLYNRTGDQRILDTIARNWTWPVRNVWAPYWLTGPMWPQGSEHQWIPDMPATVAQEKAWDWNLHHGVNVAMELKYPALFWFQNPEPAYANATFGGLDRLEAMYGLAAGRITAHEHWEPGPHQGHHPGNGQELCSIAETTYTLQKLYAGFGMGRLADRVETLMFNAYAGQITPDYWCHQYDGQSNQVSVSVAKRQFGNDATANIYGFVPAFHCCLHNMHGGWPRFIENMWLATHDRGLIAASYGPSHVTARVGEAGDSVTISERTDYPFDGDVVFTIQTTKPVAFPLHLRIPGWATNAMVEINGITTPATAGEVVCLARTWAPGDIVRLHLPMGLRTVTGYNDAVSILRGPLWFSLRLGMDFTRLPSWDPGATQAIANGFPTYDWEIRPTTPWNMALAIDPANPGKRASVTRHPISRLPFAQKNEPVQLKRGERRYEQVMWSEDAPVVITVPARQLPSWGLDEAKGQGAESKAIFDTHNRPLQNLLPGWSNQPADAAAPPPSPVHSDEPERMVELIPYGCARLRITELPVLAPVTR